MFAFFVDEVFDVAAGVVAADLEEFFKLGEEFAAWVRSVNVQDAAHLGDAHVKSFIKT